MSQGLFSNLVTLFLPYGAAMSPKRITILKGHVLRLQGRVIPLQQIGNKSAQRPLIGHLTHVFSIEQISMEKFWELVAIPEEWREVLLSRIEVLSPDWISECLRRKTRVNPEPYRVEFMRVRFILNFKYADPSIAQKSLREEIEESSDVPLKNGSFKIGEGPSNSSSEKKQLSSDKASNQHQIPFQSLEQLQRTDNLDDAIQTITQKYKTQKTIRLEHKFGKPEKFTGFESAPSQSKPINEEHQDYLIIDGSAVEKTEENLALLHAQAPLNQRLLAQFDQEVASSLESLGHKTKSRRSPSPKRKNLDSLAPGQILEPLQQIKKEPQDTFEKPLTPRKQKPSNNQLFDYILHNLDQIEDNESLFLKSETSSQMAESPERGPSKESQNSEDDDQIPEDSLLAGISNLKDVKIKRGSVSVIKSYEQKPLVEERKEQFWEKKKKFFAAATGKQKFLNQNDHIVKPLDELRAIYQLINDRGRMYAYRRAITFLRTWPDLIQTPAQVRDIPFVGDRIKNKINQILVTGTLKKLHHLKSDEKIKTMQLFNKVWGIGPTHAFKLYQKGYRTIGDLRNDVDELNEQPKIGLKYFEELQQRIPREEGSRILQRVKEACYEIIPNGQKVLEIIACGSYRRGRETCGDMDILITRKDDRPITGMLHRLVERLVECQFITDTLVMHKQSSHGSETFMGICQIEPASLHRRLDIKVYPREQFGFALLYFTGSDHFNRSMRLFARKKGLSLSDHGLNQVIRVKNESVWEGETVIAFTEEDVFRALKLEYKTPKERDI